MSVTDLIGLFKNLNQHWSDFGIAAFWIETCHFSFKIVSCVLKIDSATFSFVETFWRLLLRLGSRSASLFCSCIIYLHPCHNQKILTSLSRARFVFWHFAPGFCNVFHQIFSNLNSLLLSLVYLDWIIIVHGAFRADFHRNLWISSLIFHPDPCLSTTHYSSKQNFGSILNSSAWTSRQWSFYLHELTVLVFGGFSQFNPQNYTPLFPRLSCLAFPHKEISDSKNRPQIDNYHASYFIILEFSFFGILAWELVAHQGYNQDSSNLFWYHNFYKLV